MHDKNIKRKKLSKQERIDIYNKYNGRCGYCGEHIDIKDMQVDHIIPLYLDGKDNLENMICSCRICNHYKSTYSIDKFKNNLYKIPDKLIRDSTIFRLALKYGLIEIKDKEIKFLFEQED